MSQTNQKIEEEEAKFNNIIIGNPDILRKRLNNYSTNATGRTDSYVAQRKIFLEINLTVLIVIATITRIFFESLSEFGKIYIIYCVIFYFGFSIVNIIWNITEHRTFPKKLDEEDFWKTNWFYRGHISENRKKNKKIIPNEKKIQLVKDLNKFTKFFLRTENKYTINTLNDELENELLRDDIKNLFKLYCYESNYYRIAKWTRRFTLYGLIIIPILFIGFFI